MPKQDQRSEGEASPSAQPPSPVAAAPEAPVTAPAPEPMKLAKRQAGRPVATWHAAKRTHQSVAAAVSRVMQWGPRSASSEEQYDAAIAALVDPAAKSVEAHFAQTKLRPSHFAAAAAYHRWPIGLEMSRDEFAAKVKAAMSAVIR